MQLMTGLPGIGDLFRYFARSGVYRVVRHIPYSLVIVMVVGFFVLALVRMVLRHRGRVLGRGFRR